MAQGIKELPMRYVVTRDGKENELELQRKDDGRYEVKLSGEPHTVDLSRIKDGAYSLLIDGRSYELAVHKEKNGPYIVHLPDGGIRKVELLTPIEALLRKQKGAVSQGGGEVRTPMPGRVVKVLVESGAKVSAKDPLVVVEAMKMQNQLTAPFDGTVREVRVREGDGVEKNAVIAVVDPEA